MSVLSVGFGDSASVDTGDITKSLRFRSSGSTYLSRTFGTSTNDIKWAFSFWIKNGTMGVTNPIFSAGDGTASNYFSLERTSGNLLRVVVVYGGVTTLDCSTTAVFRDPTGHTQFLLYFDSANATSTDRLQLWQAGDGSNQSGKRLTLTYATGPIGINEPSIASWSSVVHYIGRLRYTATYGDMYLSRICFFDNSLPAMTALGYYNTEINEWVPKTRSEVKSVVDAAGASSFMLDFEDGTSLTTLGNDYSTKNNDWTLTNHSLTAGANYDWMEDRPGNNFAVLNPTDSNSLTPTDANLKITAATDNVSRYSRSVAIDYSVPTYWEVVVLAKGTDNGSTARYTVAYGVVPHRGKSAEDEVDVTITDRVTIYNAYDGTNNVYSGSTAVVAATSFATNDVLMFASYQGKVWIGKNGTWYNSGDPAAGTGQIATKTMDIAPFGHVRADSSGLFLFGQAPLHASATYHSAAGGYFRYAPPTGFLALCQANLPEGAVRNPKKHFDAKTRAGTAAAYSVTGIEFQPDFVWVKSRGRAVDHALYDSVRGVEKRLETNNTDAEVTGDTTGLTAFNSAGYSGGALDQINGTTATNSFVDWLWKANGAAVSNTNGTITSQVSANQTAGFSIVTYTGTGANATVGHGLGVAPKLVILKGRGTTFSWQIWHTALAGTEVLFFDTSAKATDATKWNSTTPSSTVFSIGTAGAVNTNTSTYVAYCFTDVPGYQKIGSYVGGGANSVYVHTGFKTRFLLVKYASGGIAADWLLLDTARNTYNVLNTTLRANLANADESTNPRIDVTSNGFTVRAGSGTEPNQGGATYVYSAIADTNGKYSNAF